MNKSRNKGDLSSRTISHIKLKSNEIIPEKTILTRNKPIAFTTLSQPSIDKYLTQNLPYRKRDEHKKRNVFMTSLQRVIKLRESNRHYDRFCSLSDLAGKPRIKSSFGSRKTNSIVPKVYSPSSIYPSTISTNYPSTVIHHKKYKTLISSPRKSLIEPYEGYGNKRRKTILMISTKIPEYHKGADLNESGERLYSNLIKQMKDKNLEEEMKERKKRTEKTNKFIADSFKSLNVKVKKGIMYAMNTLTHDIESEFGKDPNLIDEKKFSEKFRYGLKLCTVDTEPQENKNVKPRFNFDSFRANYNLRKEVKRRVTVIQIDEYTKRKRKILEKWKRSIISAAIHFKRLGLSLEDFREIHGTSMVGPYEHEKSLLFFQAIKDGNFQMFKELIKKNKYLLHDFDHFHQTTLHWMAKRNRYQMISIAVKNGVSVNAEDFAGRTPLYIASLMNNVESVMILLYELANPFYKDRDGKTAMDVATNNTIINIFKRTTLLYFFHSMGKIKKCIENVRRGLLFLYEEELKLNFSKEKFLRE